MTESTSAAPTPGHASTDQQPAEQSVPPDDPAASAPNTDELGDDRETGATPDDYEPV